MKPVNDLTSAARCPQCRGRLSGTGGGLLCGACGTPYNRNGHGYIEFIGDGRPSPSFAVSREYADEQKSSGDRIFDGYMKDLLGREPFERVLDVGCGMGRVIANLARDGYDAYGMDLPGMSEFWAGAGNDPGRFLAGDATSIPFGDGFFDIVYSIGVIEHIGTACGHCTLADDYQEKRRRYASEIMRVTRPGGRIIIACPNKGFPVDIQHGPADDCSPKSGLRSYIYSKTAMNVHPTWGRFHLLSYAETRRLFCPEGACGEFTALPLRGFFGFGRFRHGFLGYLGRAAELYVNNLPALLRPTFLNPYMLVEIRKGGG